MVGSGTSAAFVVDQIVFELLFGCLVIAFAQQLLVQRKARFDAHQLTEVQRVERLRDVGTEEDKRKKRLSEQQKQHQPLQNHVSVNSDPTQENYKAQQTDSGQDLQPDSKTNQQHDSKPRDRGPGGRLRQFAALRYGWLAALLSPRQLNTGSDDSSVFPPPPCREFNTSDNKEVHPRDGLNEERRVSLATKQQPQQRAIPIKIGVLQYYLHRLGFLSSLLQVIRYTNPYGLHSTPPTAVISFFHLNSIGFLFMCAVIGFLFPLHLTKVVALRQRSPVLPRVGLALCLLSFLLANIVSILFAIYGQVGWARAIFFFWFLFSLLTITAILNFSTRQLANCIQQMRDLQVLGPDSVAVLHQPTADPTSSAASSNPIVTTDSSSPLTVSPPLSNASSRRSSTESTDSGRAKIPLTVFQIDSLASSVPSHSSSDSLPELSRHNDRRRNSQSPLGSPRRLSAEPLVPSHPNGRRVVRWDVRRSSSNISLPPSSPTFPLEARTSSADRDSFIVELSSDAQLSPSKRSSGRERHQRNVSALSLSTTQRMTAPYVSTVRRLKRIQLGANLIVTLFVAVMVYVLSNVLSKPFEISKSANPNKYSDSMSQTMLTTAIFFGQLLVFWYSFIPTPRGYLCPRVRRAPGHLEQGSQL